MATDSTEAAIRVYQLKVILLGIEPPVWRRIQVLSSTTLAELHEILQSVMGWENDHLHQFLKDEKHYGPVDGESESDDTDDEEKTLLSDVVSRARSKFSYQYDFGDDWMHEIVVEKVVLPDGDTKYPVCLDGARACPPEDCGGAWGYENLIEIVKNPKHPDYEERREWLGPKFDPDAFDVARANKALKGFAK